MIKPICVTRRMMEFGSATRCGSRLLLHGVKYWVVEVLFDRYALLAYPARIQYLPIIATYLFYVSCRRNLLRLMRAVLVRLKKEGLIEFEEGRGIVHLWGQM